MYVESYIYICIFICLHITPRTYYYPPPAKFRNLLNSLDRNPSLKIPRGSNQPKCCVLQYETKFRPQKCARSTGIDRVRVKTLL